MADRLRKQKGKRPAAQFYWADWIKDPALRSVSSGARGLWMDMLCLMWECVPKGHLQTRAGEPYSVEMICRMTGNISEEEVSGWLKELDNSGVSSRTATGVIYSRRLVRDEHKRAKCSDAGRKGGGNPRFKKGGPDWTTREGYVYAMSREQDAAIKIGASVDPHRRVSQGGAGTIPYSGAKVVRMWAVKEMGTAEATLHDMFADRRESGEWFWLSESELNAVQGILDDYDLTLKGPRKGSRKGATKGARKRNANPSSSPSGEDAPPRGFVPPTFDDVDSYCKERRNTVDPQKWIDHYTSNGWMVGKNKMKDWRAAVRTWEKNDLNGRKPGERGFFDGFHDFMRDDENG